MQKYQITLNHITMNKEFKAFVGYVMSFLGITAFAKDNTGKSVLSQIQTKQLTDKYGETFVKNFMADLKESEKNGESADAVVSAEFKEEMKKSNAELQNMKAKIEALEKERTEFKEAIEKLEKSPADDKGKEVEVQTVIKKFKPDMTLKHNKFLSDYLQGKISAAYTTNDTIDTTELKKEFGKYVDETRIEILQSLYGTTESTAYMSSVVTDKTEIRASHAQVTSVLQQFIPKWTPKSTTKFTPLTIKNFKCKINVSIIPEEIMEDIIGYMYDEGETSLQNMFVVKYILNNMIFPKLDEERENALAVGRYKENVAASDGSYSASTALATMDGYLTQLVDLYNATDTDITWLQKGTEITESNVLTLIDAAVQEVKPLYKKQKLFVHADPDLILTYQKAYRAKYPWLKNEDGENRVKIDFTNFTFASMEGMRGSNCFFITPKENFKHLISRNPQQVKLRMQEVDYEVKVFAEWWEGTGFYLKEAIFPYISPAYATANKVTTTSTESTGV